MVSRLPALFLKLVALIAIPTLRSTSSEPPPVRGADAVRVPTVTAGLVLVPDYTVAAIEVTRSSTYIFVAAPYSSVGLDGRIISAEDWRRSIPQVRPLCPDKETALSVVASISGGVGGRVIESGIKAKFWYVPLASQPKLAISAKSAEASMSALVA